MNDDGEIDTIRRRLRFRAWHRGTREMDLLLGRFVEDEIETMGQAELAVLDELIQISDAELYALRTGAAVPDPGEDSAVLRRFIAHRPKLQEPG